MYMYLLKFLCMYVALCVYSLIYSLNVCMCVFVHVQSQINIMYVCTVCSARLSST